MQTCREKKVKLASQVGGTQKASRDVEQGEVCVEKKRAKKIEVQIYRRKGESIS